MQSKQKTNLAFLKSFSSADSGLPLFLLSFSATHFTKLISCTLIWSKLHCSVLNFCIQNAFFFFCQIIKLLHVHFPHKHQMAQAQASPFVYIITNQFKVQLLPAHLTGELTLVVSPHYDNVGVNFIYLADILYLDCNSQEFSCDLGSMHNDFSVSAVCGQYWHIKL